MSRTWDVFCKVVDNYGDAAVCWRLSVQLASEHSGRVRLWIDALPALHALCPEVDPLQDKQRVKGVEICNWTPAADFGAPAEIVVEAFGGGVPEDYVAAMAADEPRPVWIILEYLSAESWVERHHKVPSPHPRLPLERHFFFPGFGPKTGGLLWEAGVDLERDQFQSSPSAIEKFWREARFEPPTPFATVVSLFGYENPAVGAFLEMWSQGTQKTVVAVPASRLRAQVCAFFGEADPGDGHRLAKGSLEARLMPFMPQPCYDRLLWACDWNFVRGEDSFVRAQWAQRPFVWQIYPQEEGAHIIKLRAFLEAYGAGLELDARVPLVTLWEAWNAQGAVRSAGLQDAWGSLYAHPGTLRNHCRNWAGRIETAGDLAANLAQFCEERLK